MTILVQNPQFLTVFGTEVLFNGLDAAGQFGLWVTDGTFEGTHELTNIAGANANPTSFLGGPGGLNPQYLTAFGNEVLFIGLDASGKQGLWVTDGTAAGTHMVTNVVGGPSNSPSPPQHFTVFGNSVLFNGYGDIGQYVYSSGSFQLTYHGGLYGLWVTDGTAAGTHELNIVDVNGTDSIISDPTPGLNPQYLTVFGSEVLFSGLEASGHYHLQLWVTDGTAAGTHQLTNIAGAADTGLNPQDLTVFGNKVLFSGWSSSSSTNPGLWATDGTAAGTHELTNITGAYAPGIAPQDLTVFGGEVLFNGIDALGHSALWATDGTAGGTHELTNIAGASGFGLNPQDMTVFGNKVLFNGVDAAGQVGLWVTDGTANGTHEITGILGANLNGLHEGNLTVFGNEVLFSGLDSNGQATLWVTDGTAAGTHVLNDNVAPVQQSLAASVDNQSINVTTGHTITLTLTTSEPVFVTGIPTLLLNDHESATYVSGSGGNTLVFTYTVQTGDTSFDLTVTGLNFPGGASVQDVGGNELAMVAGDLALQINLPTPPPTTIQQEIAALYCAVYNRAVDWLGMSYWVNVVSQQTDASGVSYTSAATTAISLNDAALLGRLIVGTQSTYFNQTYGTLNDLDFVDALYYNIGGVHAETSAAVGYWVKVIHDAEASGLSAEDARASVVGKFVHDLVDVDLSQWVGVLTPDELSTTIRRQAVVNDKLVVSLAYLNDSEQPDGLILNAHVVGDAAFQAEVRAVSQVTSDPNTVTAAITGIHNAVAHQDLTFI